MNRLFFATAAAAALAFAGSAFAAQGLNGSYYSIGSGIGNNATAEADIAGQKPTATFTANTVCYPSCDGSYNDTGDLAGFLGSNASNLSSNLSPLDQHVINLTGTFVAPTTGSYGFSLNSDDGSELYIDGNQIVNDDGDHGLQLASGSVSLGAGNHRIRILQFEDGGGTGVTAKVQIPSSGTSDPLGGAFLTTAVPEPAEWALMLLGLAGAGAMLRSRRARELAAAAT